MPRRSRGPIHPIWNGLPLRAGPTSEWIGVRETARAERQPGPAVDRGWPRAH